MSVECRECGMELTDKDIGEHEEMCVKCRQMRNLLELSKQMFGEKIARVHYMEINANPKYNRNLEA